MSSSDSETEYDFSHHKREEWKFKGFKQIIEEMTVSTMFDLYNAERQQKDIEDSHSYTYDALMKWKVDDRTQSFHNAFYALSNTCTTLPLLIKNLDDVMKTMFFHLQLQDSMAIHSLMDIMVQIIRDTRYLFMPYIPQLLSFCRYKLIGCSDETVVKDIFTTLSFMVKYLYSDILENTNDFISQYIYFLCHKKDYVRSFASESLVYLLHKMQPTEFIAFVDKIITDYIVSETTELSITEKNLLIRGLSTLLFENIKGAKNQLIVKNKQYILLYFKQLIDDVSPTSKYWYDCILSCNKAISIQKREGFNEYFTMLESVLPQQPTTQLFYGKVLSVLIRWVMYRYGSAIETCENDVERLLKYTFQCTISTPQHIQAIPLIAANIRFANPLFEHIKQYIKCISIDDLQRILSETTKEHLYFTMILKEIIQRGEVSIIQQYFSLRYIPSIPASDCDIVTPHHGSFPATLMNDVVEVFKNQELKDDMAIFIASSNIVNLIPNIKEKTVKYFEKSPLIASILLAHVPENPIENEMLTYLKTLKTSNHLFALAYYSQKQKKPIEFTDDEKLKIMKKLYSKYSLERSAAGYLLIDGDEKRIREIISIFNDIEIDLTMMRAMIVKLEYIKSRISLASNELRKIVVHFCLGVLQIKLSKVWEPAKQVINTCISYCPELITIIMEFIENCKEGENEEKIELSQTEQQNIFVQYPINVTDHFTIARYLWEIMNDNVKLFSEEVYHKWFVNQFIKRFSSIDVALINKRDIETLTHYITIVKQIEIPPEMKELLMKLLNTTKVELQCDIFQCLCSINKEYQEHKDQILNVISNLHKSPVLKKMLPMITFKGEALYLLCRMLFIHIVQRAVEKTSKKIVLEFISQIDDEIRAQFIDDTLSIFYDFIHSKNKFAHGELDYILHTLLMINSTFGCMFDENKYLGMIVLEILQKDPTVTWEVIRLINEFSSSADDGGNDPNNLFDFKQIYPIILQRKNIKIAQFVTETLMVLPNASEYLHTINNLYPYVYQYQEITAQNVDRMIDLLLMIQDLQVPFDITSLVEKMIKFIHPNINEKHSLILQLTLKHTTLSYSSLLEKYLPITNTTILPVLQILSTTPESIVILAQHLIQQQNQLVETEILPNILNDQIGKQLIQYIHTPNEFYGYLQSVSIPQGNTLIFIEEYSCQQLLAEYMISEMASSYLLKLFKQTNLPHLIERLMTIFVENQTFSVSNLLTKCLELQKDNVYSALASTGFFNSIAQSTRNGLEKGEKCIQTMNEKDLIIIKNIVLKSLQTKKEPKIYNKLEDIIGTIYTVYGWDMYEEGVMKNIDTIKETFKEKDIVLKQLEEATANERPDDIKKHNKSLKIMTDKIKINMTEMTQALLHFHFDISGDFDIKELNKFAVFGDLPFEITENQTEQLEMTEQRIIRQNVLLRIIPGLQDIMNDKMIGKQKSDIIRIVVELLCLLPEKLRRLEVPQMVQLICNELQDKEFEQREIARKQLVEIVWKLGEDYFADLIVELYSGLHKGYLKHVLGYTTEYLLYKIVKKVYKSDNKVKSSLLNTMKNEKKMKMEKKEKQTENKMNKMEIEIERFAINDSVETILQIVYEDINGPVAEQRQVGKIRSEIEEARECKSFEILKHIGLLLTECRRIDEITTFFANHLEETKRMQSVLEIDRLLREFEKGLRTNKFIESKLLYSKGYSLIRNYYYNQQLKDVVIQPTLKLAGDNALERILFKAPKTAVEMMNNGVIDKKQHYHIIVEFGLKLMVTHFENTLGNNTVTMKDRALKDMTSNVKKCCFMKNERSITLGLKILRKLLNFTGKLKKGYHVGVVILKALKKTDVGLYQEVMKFMTDLIKKCEDSFKQKDLKEVLHLIKINLTDIPKFNANYNFLEAIMKRNIADDSLFDLMLDYGQYMIQSTEKKTQKEAKQLLELFLTRYSLTLGVHKRYVDFLIKNIDNIQMESRLTITDLLNIVIQKMGEREINESLNTIFIPIVLHISNEEEREVALKQIDLLKMYITKITKENLSKVFKMNESWLRNAKSNIKKVGWIGNIICCERLKKKKNEMIQIIEKTYLTEDDSVKQQMVEFYRQCNIYNKTIISHLLKTPMINGITSVFLQQIESINEKNDIISYAITKITNDEDVIDSTKLIKRIVDGENDKIVSVINILNGTYNENVVKMLASLIGSVESNEDHLCLIIQFLLTIVKANKPKDKQLLPIVKEILNILKDLVDSEKYFNLINSQK